MARMTPAKIVDLVEKQKDATSGLRDRFDEDYNLLYLLNENLPSAPEGQEDDNENYRIYTSNEPRVFADKVIEWSATAKTLWRTPEYEVNLEERTISNAKELFLTGVIRSADERLSDLVQFPLQSQMASLGSVRGYICGRAMLAKRADGSAYVDITPWDPLHVYWKVGTEGLEWICNVTHKSREDINRTYKKRIPEGAEGDEDESIEVFDFYDKDHNTVVTSERVLKASTIHGAERVPAFMSIVGHMPMIHSDQVDDPASHYGESIFKPNRNVWKNYNLVMSIITELMARARKPPITATSLDGNKVPENSPYETGAIIGLAAGEKIEALNLLETTRDAGTFIAMVTGEIQRGSLPHSAYGEIAFQLSGFAITQLRQGIDTVIQPVLRAMERAYCQIAKLITSQYVTGAYGIMEVSGRDRDRNYFSHEFTPEIISQGGDVEIELVGDLPRDDVGNFAIAQMAREGENPLLPDRYIHDKILKIQDTDRISDTIKEQTGERGVPIAILWNMMVAAQNQGRDQLAQIYFGELQEMLLRKQLEMQHLQLVAQGLSTPGAAGGAGAENGNRPVNGVRPTVDQRAAPQQVVGVQAPPNMQRGPVVPPGQPRPGALAGGPGV